jgi:endonuclease YncB( thermonuclease family)
MIALVLCVLVAGPTEPVYHYRAIVARVIDADTYDMQIDLGFRIFTIQPIRLAGWDCPERNTDAGRVATERATAILKAAKIIIVEGSPFVQSFARWVATVWVDGQDLGALLEPVCTRRKGPR